jgi:hypothetical protein
MSYQDKNNIGGWNPNIPEGKRKWNVGSLFASEGERLYDLVREHKPKKVIEVGTRYGCSTVHIATALKDNGFGVVHCYDTEDIHKPFPKELKKYIKFHHQDYFELKDKTCDMLYEDGAHTTGFTKRVLSETKAFKVVAVHDFLHWDCKETVRDEAISVMGRPTEIFDHEESDCGLGIWVKGSPRVKRCVNCG